MNIFPWLLACIAVIVAVLCCKDSRSKTKVTNWWSQHATLLHNAQDPGISEDNNPKDEDCMDPHLTLQTPAFDISKETHVSKRINTGYPRHIIPHQYPWTVLLLIQVQRELQQCGGALITWDRTLTESDIIVTAAHCLAKNATSYIDTVQVTVVAGKHDLRRIEDGEQIRYADQYAFPTPPYDMVSKQNDIMLVKLDKPIAFNTTIQPLHLPKPTDKLSLKAPTFATGWGSNGVSKVRIMRVLEAKALSDQDCSDGYYSIMHRTSIYSPTEMLCVQSQPKWADLCEGDGGAPLASKKPMTGPNSKWILFGVFSFTRNGSCNDPFDSFPVFAKAAYFSDWLASAARAMTAVGQPQTQPIQFQKAPGFPSGQRDPDCGKQSDSYPQKQFANKRIIGGNIANPHSWPWHVYVSVLLDASLRSASGCGGSLIRVSKGDNETDIVVTAAHCVTFDYAGHHYEFRPKKIVVIAGKHDLEQEPEVGQRNRFAGEVVIHPRFAYLPLGGVQNDVALIKLNRSVPLVGDTIRAICLPNAADPIPYHDKDCAAVGWGRTDVLMQSPPPRYLHQCRVQIFTAHECWRNGQGWTNPPFTDPEMFCAGSMDQPVGICLGDSGGPVKCKVQDQWTLFGINAIARNRSTCFTPGFPPIAMSIVEYVKWIRDEAEILTSINRRTILQP